MIHDQQLLNEFHSLPSDKQAEVIDFIAFLKSKVPQTPSSTKLSRLSFGCMKGTVTYMAPDFDEPLEDFTEYMP